MITSFKIITYKTISKNSAILQYIFSMHLMPLSKASSPNTINSYSIIFFSLSCLDYVTNNSPTILLACSSGAG